MAERAVLSDADLYRLEDAIEGGTPHQVVLAARLALTAAREARRERDAAHESLRWSDAACAVVVRVLDELGVPHLPVDGGSGETFSSVRIRRLAQERDEARAALREDGQAWHRAMHYESDYAPQPKTPSYADCPQETCVALRRALGEQNV